MCIGSYPGGELEGVNLRSVTLAQLIYLCVYIVPDAFPWCSVSFYLYGSQLIYLGDVLLLLHTYMVYNLLQSYKIGDYMLCYQGQKIALLDCLN